MSALVKPKALAVGPFLVFFLVFIVFLSYEASLQASDAETTPSLFRVPFTLDINGLFKVSSSTVSVHTPETLI